MSGKAVRISSKGQITLPEEFRRLYNLREGDEVLILPAEDGILIKRKKARLRGFLSGKLDIEGFKEDIRRLRQEWRLNSTS